MATDTMPADPAEEPYIAGAHVPLDAHNYLNNGHTLKSWLLTKDHKRIALLFLCSVTFFFSIGGIFALLFRIELLTPAGDFVEAETYNKLFSMHGIIMVFLFLVPVIPGVLGNFLLPMMLGARDLAFPRINLLSWYLYMIGGSIILGVVFSGGVDTGWTFYTPYSSVYSNSWVILTVLGIFIAGFSSILTGLNFFVTVHKLRPPGMTWFKMPLFVWSIYATSIMMLLGTPVVAMTLMLLGIERFFHVGIFNPAWGGDPILFQHLFWFYSHPAVYIMVLPGMAVVSEIVPCFSRNYAFGYSFVAISSLAIAFLGFLVWGHHLFVSGESVYSGMVFAFLSFMVAIPSGIKVFNWTATLYKGSVSLQTPMLYALGFIGLFTLGGLTGLFLPAVGIDLHVHDTYFVIAHFHYIMVGGTVMAYLGGIHFWWPKISGRMYPEWWGRLSALIIFIGFNLTFFPQFLLGYAGMPRRYWSYPPEFQTLNVLSTAGATILGIGYLLPLCYFAWSIKYAPRAGPNPWGATGLEWRTPSPPPTHNFDETPDGSARPYDYPAFDRQRAQQAQQAQHVQQEARHG